MWIDPHERYERYDDVPIKRRFEPRLKFAPLRKMSPEDLEKLSSFALVPKERRND